MVLMQRASRARLRALLAAIGGAALACADSPVHPIGCGGTVTLDVGATPNAAQTPRFDWSPRCGVTGLIVILLATPPANDPVTVWSILAPENAQMGPPVQYGLTPRGARTTSAAQLLVAGRTYRVSIVSTIGLDVASAYAEKTFTR
jgi:hypothetical protein